MYKTSCAEAVHLFEDRSNARETVGGISESLCVTQESRLSLSYSTEGHH